MWLERVRYVEGQNVRQDDKRTEILRKIYGCNKRTETCDERKKMRNMEESKE